MDLKQLIRDDDAVSPVIGVILMVAITVILAAVVASFVLNLNETQSTTPQVSFEFEYDPAGGSASPGFGSDGDLTITHTSGDSVQAGRLTVINSDSSEPAEDVFDGASANSDLSAGDTGEISIDSDDTIRITYTDETGQESTTLATFEGPDA